MCMLVATYIGGLGGNGFGTGLGLTLGTGAGVSFTPGEVPVESLLAALVGTGLFLSTVPERRVLHPSVTDIVIAAAKQSHKASFFIS